MIYLRQSTASQELLIGQFVDETDGFTAEAGLTINNTDIKLWKTGVLTLASKNSGGATFVSNAVYSMTLDATDTDTIGPMQIFIHVAGARPVRLECCVLDEAVYDVMFGTVAPLVSGSNAGTTTFGSLTVTGATTLTGNVALAAGLTITQSTANTPGLSVTGNGTGAGILGTGGSTGDGIKGMSGAGATGDGICGTAASTNGNGIQSAGTGIGDGIKSTGGATGRGIAGIGGSSSGDGIVGTGSAGHGIRGIGIGSAKHGILGNGGTNGTGIVGSGAGTGHGINGTVTGTGKGIQADSLTVTGTTTLTGAVSMGSTFVVTGTTTLAALTTSGAVTFNSFTPNFAADVINASALNANAVTEIQTGLATAASIAALNNLSAAAVNAEMLDVLVTDVLADSVAADTVRPTIAQAIYMVCSFLTERVVSGTTCAVKKPDGTTNLMTFTLNSSTAPTSITRAT